MAKVYRSSLIEAPADEVWGHVRDFNGLPGWFPGVTRSRIEAGMLADQIGCVRSFELEGGAVMRERLLALSDRERSWAYTMIEGPLPISNYHATFRLLPVTDGNRTFAECAVELDVPREHEAEVLALLGRTYQGAFDNVKRHFRALSARGQG